MNYQFEHKIGESGFSLTELIVVLAIMTTLLSIVTISFHDWQVKNNVEAQVKKMATDISELRVRAMTMKQRQSITLTSNSYVFKFYTSDSDSEPKCTGGTLLPGKTFNVAYKLKRNATDFYNGTCENVGGDTFEIDERGMLVGSTATIFIDNSGSATLDCLTLHTVRVNVGKTNGANCDDK